MTEVIAAIGDNLVERTQLDDLSLGAVGGLVEHEPPILHTSSDHLHRRRPIVLRVVVNVEGVSLRNRSLDQGLVFASEAKTAFDLFRSNDILHRSTDVLGFSTEDYARTPFDLFGSYDVLRASRGDDTRTRLDLQGPTDLPFMSDKHTPRTPFDLRKSSDGLGVSAVHEAGTPAALDATNADVRGTRKDVSWTR